VGKQISEQGCASCPHKGADKIKKALIHEKIPPIQIDRG
jgi:hypothetical protein